MLIRAAPLVRGSSASAAPWEESHGRRIRCPLKGCGPEPRAIADDNAADGIDHCEGADGDAILEHMRRRPDAALEIHCRRAEARADAAQGKFLGRMFRRGVAQLPIWRIPVP